MTDYHLSPDDPRLTAYALGELAGPELAAVEAALRHDPDARATVAEIRAASAQLAAALATEAAPPLRQAPPLARAAIIPGRDLRKLDGGPGRRPGEIFRYSRSFFVLTGLAAACLVLVFSLRQDRSPAVRASAPVAKVKDAGTVVAPAPKTADVGVEAVAPAERADTILPKSLALLDQARATGALAAADAPLIVAPPAPETVVVRNEAVASADPLKTPVAASLPPDGAGTNAQSSTQSSPSDQNALAAAPTTGPATIAANPAAPASPPIAPARRQEIFAPASGLASSARDFDRVPVSENRGLLTFTAPTFNFDEIAPRYAATPVAKADATVSTTAGGEHDNEFISVAQQPVSTFAIDSDTAGYADVRNFLQKRQRPPRELVHIEEMLNFFPFGYAPPKGDAPFAASMEVADAPWLPAHRLVRIGLKAREVTATPRPPANLVFVLDVLTTERQRSQLPMIRESIEFLLGRLRADDRVSIVTTMNGASLVLPPTLAAKTPEIVAALARLGTLGSSSRAKGLQLAYEIARANFLPGSGNHVILCTDGNAATTITAEGPLARLIETQTKAGVTLTAFGFGMGLYRDPLIELLADYGKGNYAYIDTRRAAEKYLVEDINGPSVTVAKDVAVEVEFNPAKVARYRLIGYENRVLKKEDFKGDAFGADEISAGHAVTALFEIEPVAARAVAVTPALDPNELLTMKVRYKKPGGALARKIDFPLFDSRTRFVDASADFKFAAAVAGLGMILRDSPHKGLATLPQVIEWAEASAGNDPGGYRTEFVELAREAEKIRQ